MILIGSNNASYLKVKFMHLKQVLVVPKGGEAEKAALDSGFNLVSAEEAFECIRSDYSVVFTSGTFELGLGEAVNGLA